MKKKKIFEVPGYDNTHVTVDFLRYDYNSTLAVVLNSVEGGDTFAVITVNINSTKQRDTMAFVDTNNCPWAEKFLTKNNIAQPLNEYEHSGYCVYPLYKFDADSVWEEDGKTMPQAITEFSQVESDLRFQLRKQIFDAVDVQEDYTIKFNVDDDDDVEYYNPEISVCVETDRHCGEYGWEDIDQIFITDNYGERTLKYETESVIDEFTMLETSQLIQIWEFLHENGFIKD